MKPLRCKCCTSRIKTLRQRVVYDFMGRYLTVGGIARKHRISVQRAERIIREAIKRRVSERFTGTPGASGGKRYSGREN